MGGGVVWTDAGILGPPGPSAKTRGPGPGATPTVHRTAPPSASRADPGHFGVPIRVPPALYSREPR